MIKSYFRFFYYSFWICAAVILGGGTAFFATHGFAAARDYVASYRQAIVYQQNSTPFWDPGQAERIALGALNSTTPMPTTGKAVRVDLNTMKLALYEDGAIVEELPIISRGRPGSPWETPPGIYKILSKEETHFSSIGRVWMPYSMQFFGNFFIHGWPYYENGKEVARGYSGGCIRLRTADAEKVYRFVSRGTPLYIFGTEAVTTNTESATTTAYYFLNQSAKAPVVKAKAFIVADLDTGEVILERNKDKVLAIASLTKLMTAAVSLEVVNQYQLARVSQAAVATFGLAGSLKTGDQLVTKDLLYPLLLESSNDAAEVLARHVGRPHFMDSMNEKAISIGLEHTSYDDPSGLSAKNVSTAEDLFRLSQYLYKYKSYVLELTKKKSATVESYTWHNNSRFVRDKNYLGGKNGYTTEAGHTLVALFELPLSEFSKRHIAIVLLGADNKEADARNILKYLSANVYYGGKADANALFERIETQPGATSSVSARVPSGDTVELAFVGDIMTDRGVRKAVEKSGSGDYDFLFQYAESLKDPDILVGNLEGPISNVGKNVGSIYSFRMDPQTAPALAKAGFDVLSVANNHAGDWTIAAFDDTLRRLKANQLLAIGGGRDKYEATTPKIIERDGVTFGFLAATAVGPNWLAATHDRSGILLASDPQFLEYVAAAAKRVDVLTVAFHFGDEYEPKPNAEQTKLAKATIDAGAKLVIGHHPHVIEPVEKYHNGLIAYSLGNFIFDQNFSEETMRGLLLRVFFQDGTLVDYQQQTVALTNDYQPQVDSR